MKKPLIYIAVFIIICCLADFGIKESIAKQNDNRSPYCLSFASIGANLLECRLDCWAKIKTANNFTELDIELIKILHLLNLSVQESSIKHKQHDGQLSVSYQITKGQNDYYINLQTENHTTYFLLTAISHRNDIALRIDEKLLKQKYLCQSYFLYKGVIYACPDLEGLYKILYVICKCLQVEGNDVYESTNMLSMAGFSSLLKDKYSQVEIAGKKYNLQIAIRNDGNKDQTYIYLGTPLLLNDY